MDPVMSKLLYTIFEIIFKHIIVYNMYIQFIIKMQ